MYATMYNHPYACREINSEVAQLRLQHVRLSYVSIFDKYFVQNVVRIMLMKNYFQFDVELIADDMYNLPCQLLIV
jgi:hypothetical protein